MAARTTTANGNWNSSGTWTGGNIPGNGDTATISHAVTVTANQTVGHSPGASDATAAVLVQSGGSVTINTGVTLTCRGDWSNSASNTTRSLTMNAGSTFEFDASAAATPSTARYRMINPSQYSGTQPCLKIDGDSGSRCTFRSNSGGANGRIVGSGSNYRGLIDAEYCDFLRIGDASNFGIAFRANSDGSDSLASVFRLVNCTFDACGEINSDQAMGAHAKFTVQNCTWSNSVGTNSILFSCYNNKSGSTSVRLLDGNVFDKVAQIQAPRDLTVTGNVFNAGFVTTDTDAEGWALFEDNFIRATSASNTFNMFGNAADCFVFYDDSGGSNPHFIQIGQFETATPLTVDGFVFEFNGSDGTGDCIMVGSPSAACAFTVQNCIVLPNASGETSGTLLSALGNANCTITIEKNTAHVGTNGGVAVGETYAGHSGMLASFRSNLFWDTSARGYKLFDSGTNNSVSNLVTSGNANYNGGYNVAAGSNSNGYNNLEFSAGSPGANDVSTDPDFVDATRDLASWDSSLGGAGTAANAIAELKKRNTPSYNSAYNVTDLLTYIREGFAPQNDDYEASGHDSGRIGAVDYAAPAGHTSALPVAAIAVAKSNPSATTTEKNFSALPVKAIAVASNAPAAVTTERHYSAIPVKAIAVASNAPAATTTERHYTALPVKAVALAALAPTVAVTERHYSALPSKAIAATANAPSATATEHHRSSVPTKGITLAALATLAATTEHHMSAVQSKAVAVASLAPGATTTERHRVSIPVATIAVAAIAPGARTSEHHRTAISAGAFVMVAYAPSATVVGGEPARGFDAEGFANPVITSKRDGSFDAPERASSFRARTRTFSF